MMRSMYTAVSGLRTHQGKMDTIGHNIANVNTVGYKRGQVTFKEAFSQMLAGASGPQGGKGGTNPQQVGLGVNTGAINTVHTVGGMQRTENPTDLMINGEGFFTVTDDTSYNNKYFTRDGSLNIDVDGNLVTSDGYMVLGYMFDENGNITDRYERIRIDQNEEVPPEATRSITFSGNLNSNLTIEGSGESTDNKRAEWPIVDTIIYDSLGNEYQLSFRLEKEVKDKTGGGTEDLDNKAGDKKQKWKLNLIRMENLGTGYYAEVTKDSDGDVKDNPFSGAFEGTSFTFNDMGN